MTVHDGNRRTFLKAAGAAAATALVAGCSDDGNGNGNGNGNGDGNGDGVTIAAGEDIRFDGQTGGWEGLEPSEIAGETNPTLILEDGEEYTIGWTEGDGTPHNIEIRDDGGDVVDDLSTDQVDDPGDDQILEFTASGEMASYVCAPHENTMVGDIQVE
ncbi:plastocyanin/azurin family copper-binding protein [Natrarchaeobius oligotrophus]|uniref:Twin-arginine translocation signal domain-containing protein n=1 Tax=Natrarchaeobius chitinivorans TaxID=1679083 RepID=A0A3N6MG60_NATCH|nr:plastocyanin/azurin family copper-binding protein [Natrarchaeobius chitinivorans]RQG99964.1 twin-arginine translocation signal domain-containing protein [Natrarchaeobius chitinivorans]